MRITFTLTDGRTLRFEYSLAADPHNCGYSLLGYNMAYIVSNSRGTDPYCFSTDLARVVSKLALEQILKRLRWKRAILSGVVKELPKVTYDTNKRFNTYDFIKYNRLSTSKPVTGSHSGVREQYSTILAWFDHDHVVKYTKRDQVVINKFIKEIRHE